MACTKDTVKLSGLNVWSDNVGPAPEVEYAKLAILPLG